MSLKTWIGQLYSTPLNLLLAVAALLVILYYGTHLYDWFRPQTYQEKYMHCLELGSDARAGACVKLLKGQN